MTALLTAAAPQNASRSAELAPTVSLLGIGTAVPGLPWSKADTRSRMAAAWDLRDAAFDRWRRIVEGSGIEQRYAVLPPDDIVGFSTADRMRQYELHAPPLAEQAARAAMRQAGVDASHITDVVIVSCTGFSAPGVDVALIDRLGLRAATRRTTIGFMGCFGAINGLRVASGLCAADRRAVTLLVCVELCSLHMRGDRDVQNQVASALFADGAAAAVLAGSDAAAEITSDGSESGAAIARIGAGSSMLIAEGRDWMTWRITDAGFAMTLARDVPVALRRSIASFVRDMHAPRDSTLIVHPGGPGVVDAVDQALQTGGGTGIECSRDILRRFGNMSSGTVLFVLEDAISRGHAMPAVMLAFGPGLTIEGLRLEAAQTPPTPVKSD